jgi:protocatechuate 3,4-dioxygenase beta subunit
MVFAAFRRSPWLRFTSHVASSLVILVMSSPAFAQLLEDDDGPPPQRDLNGVKITPVTGRVVDEQGKPVGNAQVAIVTSEFARSARPKGVSIGSIGGGGETLPRSFDMVGPVATDGQGEFELQVPESRTGVYSGLQIYATAEGHGCVVQDLGQVASRKPMELKLSAEHVIRGRVIDLNGQPASGVKVYPVFRGAVSSGYPIRSSGPFSARRPLRQLLDIWKPVITDDKGRFLIRGLRPEYDDPQRNGRVCTLQLEGDNYTPAEPLYTYIKPVPIASDESGTISLSPAKRIRGRVTFADTGKPVANARIVCPQHLGGLGNWVETRTDANGEYSISPFAPETRTHIPPPPPRYKINIFPPNGETYLVFETEIPDFQGTNKQLDVKLERGVLIKGRVTESKSETAVAGARIQFIGIGARFNTSNGDAEPTGLQTAISKSDGTYELAAPRGVGHLVVLGPTLDYVKVETSEQEIRDDGKRGKQPWHADAFARIDLKPAVTEHRVDFELRKGIRLKGKVVDLDKKPVDEFVILSASYVAFGYKFHGYGALPGSWRECRDGEFELPGCDPKGIHIVYIYDPKHGLGATATLIHKNEIEPAIVQLQPCGSAVVRFVDSDGQPVPNVPVFLGCKLSEGPPHRLYNSAYLPNLRYEYPLEADMVDLRSLQTSTNYAVAADGTLTFTSLIPGARYMAHWMQNGNFQEFMDTYLPLPHVDFTVKSGEQKNLGDIVMEGKNKYLQIEGGATIQVKEDAKKEPAKKNKIEGDNSSIKKGKK